MPQRGLTTQRVFLGGTDDLADRAPVVVEGAEGEVPHPEGQGDGEAYEPSAGEDEEA